jgi:pantoate--beta-alanine ligase
MYESGIKDASLILSEVKKFIEGHPYAAIDYVKVCDTTTLRDIDHVDGNAVLALAVTVNKTRLIDNYVFGDVLNI